MAKLPVPYHPTFDFRRFAQLGQPVDGERLASQLEELARFSEEFTHYLHETFDANGGLKPGSVTSAMLEHGILDKNAKALQAVFDKAIFRANALLGKATSVDLHNTAEIQQLQQEVTRVLAITVSAQSFADKARLSAEIAQKSSHVATSAKIDAENALNSVLLAEAEARLSEEQAYLWAEYLAGPVVKADPKDPQFNQAVDDGYYSAKFWALQARRASPGGLAWYLGAFTTPPVGNNADGPLEAGHMYFNSQTKVLNIWDGMKWTPAERATLGIGSIYAYFPSGVTDHVSGPDYYGATPVFKARDTFEVHVNGVQLWAGDVSSGGDYDIDFNTNPTRVVFAENLEPGDVVTLIEVTKFHDIQPAAGVEVFKLADLSPSSTA